MTENLLLLLAGLAGCLLGMVFFIGLWWTVRKGIAAKRPALWFLGSMLLRTMIVMLGFYFISRGSWKRLLACLVGFICARLIVTLRVRARLRHQMPIEQAEESVAPTKEASYAP